MKLFFVTLLTAVMFYVPHAGAAQWEIDPDHSNFYFGVQHIYSTIRGQFNEFSGEIFFDPQQLDKSTINLEVKVASINTNIPKRDNHLRTEDFFDSSKFPLMTFRSSSISKTGDNIYTAAGKIKIKDVEKDGKLEFTYRGPSKHPLMKGKMVAGLDTTLQLDRLEYGVGNGKFYKLGVVGKDVDVLISLELLKDE